MFDMRRREFITLLGGAAAAWPIAVRAEQQDRLRRVGVLMSLAEDDRQGQRYVAAFLHGLQELGWNVHNLHVDVRWVPPILIVFAATRPNLST